MQRVALHPLDQFRAFVALRDKGQSDAEIAAAFFVTPQNREDSASNSLPSPLPCLRSMPRMA